jgi:polysaccharide biosynthesis/export protein
MKHSAYTKLVGVILVFKIKQIISLSNLVWVWIIPPTCLFTFCQEGSPTLFQRTRPCVFLVSAIVLFLTAEICCAQVAQSTTEKADPPKAHDQELTASTTPSSSYRIGVGDVLHITVWEEPQFTETAVVRPDGMVSIPLLSEIKVSGLSPEEAEKVLTARLQKFVHSPRVTVTVQEIRSRMVYVTGEVMRPGAYPLLDRMNVVQVISRSGGMTDYAKKAQVYVLRAANGTRINVDYRKVLKGQAPEENVDLEPGDTVVVP